MGLSFNTEDTYSVQVNLCIPKLFSIYVTLESGALKHLVPHEWVVPSSGRGFWYPERRNIGVRVFDNKIWFSLWDNPMEWNSSDPWWWSFNIKPVDLLLGKEKLIEKIEEPPVNVIVNLPEGEYPATVVLKRWTNKRPLWRARERCTYSIELETPIPVPGKGENSWDLDEDAIYLQSGPGRSVDDAVADLIESVTRTRTRYGGPEWLPS
jgi:hypothetical protein